MSAVDCAATERELPWYLNGTLDAQEMVAVENHLRECAVCRALAAEEMQVARQYSTLRTAEESGAPAQASEAGLNDLLMALKRPVRRRSEARLGLALAAAACLLLAPAAWLVVSTGPTPEPHYRTLGTVGDAAAGPVLQLVFNRDTPEQAMRRLLETIGATIVSGPSRGGVYRLALREGTSPEAVQALLTRLRADPAVLLAEVEL